MYDSWARLHLVCPFPHGVKLVAKVSIVTWPPPLRAHVRTRGCELGESLASNAEQQALQKALLK